MSATPRFRLVLLLRHAGALRNFQSVIHGLSGNGHEVHLAFESARLKTSGHDLLLEEVLALPGVSSGAAPAPSRRRWAQAGRAARVAQDYLRYLDPEYRDAKALRARALAAVSPRALQRVVSVGLLRRRAPRAALVRALKALDRRVPADPALVAALQEHAPDAVLVSPLVDFGSPQADLVRAARALGLPTGLLVHSWDNLTNKGLIPDPPDLVAVWNDDQRDEAIDLHRVPPDAVAVTGATPYDQWFEREPSLDRAAFCERAGLDPGRPYVLYLCSSPFIAPREGTFVREWIVALREQGGAAAGASILVRPHPQNAKAWSGVDLSDLPDVAIWPAGGADPVEEASRRGFYDSIHHAAAVAGINTSALIESAIVGRTVHTLLDPRSAASQTGTLHFHMLLRHNHGFLRVASSIREQAEQLADSLAHPAVRDDAFLRAFARPHGLDRAATPYLVEAIERLAGTRGTRCYGRAAHDSGTVGIAR